MPAMLKDFDPSKLRDVLEAHARYRSGRPGGRRADLSYAALSNL